MLYFSLHENTISFQKSQKKQRRIRKKVREFEISTWLDTLIIIKWKLLKILVNNLIDRSLKLYMKFELFIVPLFQISFFKQWFFMILGMKKFIFQNSMQQVNSSFFSVIEICCLFARWPVFLKAFIYSFPNFKISFILRATFQKWFCAIHHEQLWLRLLCLFSLEF